MCDDASFASWQDRNTIEMQSITALAHLHCCVLYMVDISEQCGYSIRQQVSCSPTLAVALRPHISCVAGCALRVDPPTLSQ